MLCCTVSRWRFNKLSLQKRLLCESTHASLVTKSADPCEQLARKGRYEEALSQMDEADQEALRTLKYQQYWTASLGILKLQDHMHRRVFRPVSLECR